MRTAQIINEKGNTIKEFILFVTDKEAKLIANIFLASTEKVRKADVKKLRSDFENAPIYL
jgi:hypothetical protein